uniref:ZFP91 zinc finger protein, atypical E3 ubiquitin ligase n=1 Tax=Nothoprocta perdicaria TaxID=30464 RepID=A0A8C6YRD9_NOTPE
MGAGRRGAGSGAVLTAPRWGSRADRPHPAPDNYSTLNERDHGRTLERSGELGDVEPVKAAPLMVSERLGRRWGPATNRLAPRPLLTRRVSAAGRGAGAAAAAAGVVSRGFIRKTGAGPCRSSSPGAAGAVPGWPGAAVPEWGPRAAALTAAVARDVAAPKEEQPEEAAGAGAPGRSWRSSRAAARQRPAESPRAARARPASLQLVCKSEPDTEQLEYEVTEQHQSPAGVSDDDDDEMLVSEEEVPFKDDPRDETYKPHLEKEAPKQRRKGAKGKEEKEKQKEIKVEVKEESEFQEDEEPPRKKKPPIQYVRCEMEGCGTVLAHPRYLQHHIKYQHLLKKKYGCCGGGGGAERLGLVADGKLFVGSAGAEALAVGTDLLGATTEVLVEDSDSTGP